MNIPEEKILAVKKGAAWLDEHLPRWEAAIDFSALKLSDSCRCVLGQLFGNYTDGTKFAAISIGRGFLGNDENVWAVEHGFLLSADDYIVGGAIDYTRRYGAWKELDEAWINLLRERGLEW